MNSGSVNNANANVPEAREIELGFKAVFDVLKYQENKIETLVSMLTPKVVPHLPESVNTVATIGEKDDGISFCVTTLGNDLYVIREKIITNTEKIDNLVQNCQL